MKIKPVINKSGPLYPTLMALAGVVLAGCDKQTAPGSVPYEQKAEVPENQQPVPGKAQTPSPIEEEPLKLGGETPALHLMPDCNLRLPAPLQKTH